MTSSRLQEMPELGFISKLNLGCGLDIRKGSINTDRYLLNGVDVACDLNRFPYPFKNDTFEEIWAFSVLEHLPDTLAVINELYRILKNQGIVKILVPYWNSKSAFGDVTHVRYFDFSTFDFLDEDTPAGEKRGYYSDARFKIVRMEYTVNIDFLGKGKSIYFKQSSFSKFLKEILKHVPNTIQALYFELRCVKACQDFS